MLEMRIIVSNVIPCFDFLTGKKRTRLARVGQSARRRQRGLSVQAAGAYGTHMTGLDGVRTQCRQSAPPSRDVWTKF